MFSHKKTVLVAALPAAFAVLDATPSHAQTDEPDTRFVVGSIEELTVVGSGRGRDAEIPGSVDVVTRDQLRNEHVNLTMDLFKKVPGVTFSRYNQGIVSMDIAIRGFNAEGESPNTKLLIDGIPMNRHAGVGEMDPLFPLDLDHIEVVKGTNDPRYGLFNIAGNINMHTRRDEAREVEVLMGSFATRELQGYFSDDGEKLRQQYSFGLRDTDGYRDHSELDRTSVSGRWFYDATPKLSVGVIARLFEFDADAPGYLTYTDAHATPTLSYDFSATDGGSKESDHLSLHVDYAIGDSVDWSFKAYNQDFENRRFVRFTAAGSQQERFDDETQRGFVSTLSWQPAATVLLNWGVDYQAQDNVNQRFATVERERTGAALRDHAFDYDVYGTFAQAETRLGDALKLIGALRADRLGGDFVDRRSGFAADINDYGTLVQPKLSVLYDVNDSVSVFANAGRSFQTGVGAGAYPPPGGDVDASMNDGREIGATLRTAYAVDLRLAFWWQTATDELVLKFDNSGDLENVGETNREGWELTVGWRPFDALYVWGSYSDQEAELVNPGALVANIRGNTLHHTPDFNASLGAEYRFTPRIKGSLFTNWQGDYFLDNSNTTGRFGGYALTDLTVNYELERLSFTFRVNNLFDEYFEYAWHDSVESFHSPGAERSFDAALAWAF
jgi:iron complex outermembrane receptor protein